MSDSQPSTTVNWTVTADQPWLQFTPSFGAVSTGTNSLSVAPIVNQAEAWTSTTSLVNAPNGQEDGSAVWTGKEMIVWGGHGPIGVMVNTGAKYDPAADAWTGTTSTLNAPSPRWGHRAVWTGKEMILWGGAPAGSAPLADGYRYDPVLDVWSPPISTVGAPSARRVHVAVWTGTEMFVWGGLTNSGATNTGARYNPTTDTWASVSTIGAPSPRDYLSAVWTGTDIIVFGGSDNTGLHYNPATDSWSTPTSTVGAPSRNNPCAVWTGSDMIIWSGYDGTTQPNTGARYTLATDSWQAMTTVNAPVGRRSGVAVWTGLEMIIWGGYDGSGFNNLGQRYLPPVALTPGVYTGSLTVTDPNATNSPQTISVTLTVTP